MCFLLFSIAYLLMAYLYLYTWQNSLHLWLVLSRPIWLFLIPLSYDFACFLRFSYKWSGWHICSTKNNCHLEWQRTLLISVIIKIWRQIVSGFSIFDTAQTLKCIGVCSAGASNFVLISPSFSFSFSSGPLPNWFVIFWACFSWHQCYVAVISILAFVLSFLSLLNCF